MCIRMETASAGAGAPVPAEFSDLLARAGTRAPGLAGAGFAHSLSLPHPLPGRADAERVVVLGIGGSALGARSVHRACPGSGVIPLRVVDNIDPEAFESVWAAGDPARTAWVVVSKSGKTTETLAQCALARERLSRAGAWERTRIVTGATGPLRELALADGLAVHDVPEEVGGRFSVFTPAGTVPLALAGHDVEGLLTGARAALDHCLRPASIAANLAALLVGAAGEGRNVVALWSYAERLEPLGEWVRQLWAESLGKIRPDGRRTGQTPLACVGSTDQHSVQQLMVEGPSDKVVVILAGPRGQGPAVPEGLAGAAGGHEMGEILHAMRRATTAEMVRAGCPAAALHLERWSEGCVGRLMMILLCVTVLAGDLLGVDPYGQPGVEKAKLATRDLLADPGGETDSEIARLLGEGGGIRCS